ncbi:MAG: hypothetical protein Q8W51_13145 [Candidatus Palauibacterales bacterium]|nr:hypothetical protein [Candidatus Palauibacterales bacterium]MDP2530668.1 hypothetical protein [Candidatus Palauibacterales bacterium]MDP2583377.1 hypothetical protein [Candidatus Palauibacterales bacterium]
MIRVRDVFQIEPEHMQDAKALANRMFAALGEEGRGRFTLMTDLVADFFTLVFESDHEDLAAFESAFASTMSNPDAREVYAKFRATIVSGRREIFTIVE